MGPQSNYEVNFSIWQKPFYLLASDIPSVKTSGARYCISSNRSDPVVCRVFFELCGKNRQKLLNTYIRNITVLKFFTNLLDTIFLVQTSKAEKLEDTIIKKEEKDILM